MDVGTTLEIQFKDEATQLTTKLVGEEHDKYLMVKWPTINTMADASSLICKGNTVFVRYIYEGVKFGFQSHILEVISCPAKLIFIKYPEKVEADVLREHRRIDCYLPASVRIADNVIKGSVVNISEIGLLFVAKMSTVENIINLLEINSKIGLSFQLPGVQKELTMTAKLRNITKGKDKVSIGIEYGELEVEVQKKLSDYFSTVEA